MDNKIDLLDRNEFIENVIKIVDQLSEIKKGCCFSIEGGWGIGKTFVIEEVSDRLKQKQSEMTFDDQYFVFNYNCWKYDYYKEPSVAIISSMLESLEIDKKWFDKGIDKKIKSGWKIAKDNLIGAANECIKNKIGLDLISLYEDIKTEEANMDSEKYRFNNYFNYSKTIEKIRENIKEIANERTIVLVVDELDRCIPHYAIKVLERLHHIFYGLDNIILILAIDREQLNHSVEEMFGAGQKMNVDKYLRKFIDFSLKLDNGLPNSSFLDKYNFYTNKFIKDDDLNDKQIFDDMLKIMFKNIDIRTQEKLIEKANIIHSIICKDKADIVVMAFEILYEILILQHFGDIKMVAIINNRTNEQQMKNLGGDKIQWLKELQKHACGGSVISVSFDGTRKYLIDNFYGKLLWMFTDTFYESKNNPYIKPDNEEFEMYSKISKKYVDMCKIIK